MLASLSVLVSLAVLPFVSAQDSNLGIAAIEAHFEQSHIVEDYLESFEPVALLSLNYPGVGDVTPGQQLTIPEVRPTPTVTVTPANSSVSLNGTFTIAMFDINAVGDELPQGPTRHWLVNGVTLEGNTVSNATATAITTYAGPGPAAGSGAHRYIVALYEQPAEFTAPEGFTEPTGVEPFDFKAYLENANLGPLVAANYIVVEEGTFTGSAIPTSPVDSATLAAPSGGSSGVSGRPTTDASDSAGPEPTDDAGSAIKLSAWAAPVAALFGGLAAVAL